MPHPKLVLLMAERLVATAQQKLALELTAMSHYLISDKKRSKWLKQEEEADCVDDACSSISGPKKYALVISIAAACAADMAIIRHKSVAECQLQPPPQTAIECNSCRPQQTPDAASIRTRQQTAMPCSYSARTQPLALTSACLLVAQQHQNLRRPRPHWALE